jgi:hypothetical protein
MRKYSPLTIGIAGVLLAALALGVATVKSKSASGRRRLGGRLVVHHPDIRE